MKGLHHQFARIYGGPQTFRHVLEQGPSARSFVPRSFFFQSFHARSVTFFVFLVENQSLKELLM